MTTSLVPGLLTFFFVYFDVNCVCYCDYNLKRRDSKGQGTRQYIHTATGKSSLCPVPELCSPNSNCPKLPTLALSAEEEEN